MKKHIKSSIFLVVSLCFLTDITFANAGTPLMWAAPLHLVFGNLLIGIGEGLLLGFIFRLPRFNSIGVMIVANYFSAWTAYFILNLFQPLIDNSITIYEIQPFIWFAYGLAFLYTLIAELPFIFFCMRKKTRPIVCTLIASLVVQTISYCAVFYWYWGASYDSLFRNTHIVQSFDFQNPKSILYFIGEDKNIYQMQLDGSNHIKIYDPPQKQELMKLYLQKSETGANLCLSLLEDFYTEREKNCVVIKENILPIEQLDVLNVEEDSMVVTEAIDYRSQQQQEWTIYAGFWAAQGLEFWNNKTKESFYISLETPFAQWYVISATVLPGDEVVFQFGNQVCIYSRPTKALSLLTKGVSPVVVFNNAVSTMKVEKE